MSPANQMRIRYEPFYGHVTFLWSLAAACKLCLCAILPLLQMLRNSKHATAHIGTFIVMNRPCLHHVSACGTVNIAPAVWTIYDVLHFIAVSQYFGRESPAEKNHGPQISAWRIGRDQVLSSEQLEPGSNKLRFIYIVCAKRLLRHRPRFVIRTTNKELFSHRSLALGDH